MEIRRLKSFDINFLSRIEKADFSNYAKNNPVFPFLCKQDVFRKCSLKELKAMDQPDHVTSIIAFTVCKVIRKIITKMQFRYQTDVKQQTNR